MDIKSLKDKILQLAIQGKLVPQNENDEPASVLLEKINNEKDKLIKDKIIKKEKVLPKISEKEKLIELPKGWEWSRLGDVVQVNPRNKVEDELEVSFIPMSLFSDGYCCNHDSEIRTWGEVKSGFTHFAENDIAIAKITPCFENRKSAILKNLKNGIGAGTTELYILRGYRDLILPQFLYNIVVSKAFIDGGKATYTGTAGQQRVKKDFIMNYVISIPPLEEQKRIVNRVDELFKLIDELDNNKQDLLYSIANTRNKVLHLAIQGQLVEQSESDESANVLLERIKALKEQLIKEKVIKKEKLLPDITDDEKTFELPSSWEWCRLGDISTIKGGKRIPAGKQLLNEPTEHMYIRVTDMKNGTVIEDNIKYISDDIYEQIKNYYIEKDDIYMTIAGTIGRVGTIPNKFHMANLTENASKIKVYEVNKDFIYRILDSQYVKMQISNKTKKVGQPKLALNQIASIIIPLPPLEEQKRIVIKLDSIIDYLDKLKKEIELSEVALEDIIK